MDGTFIIYKAAGPAPLLLVNSFRLSFETSAHLIHYKSESRSGFGLPFKYKWIYRFFISFFIKKDWNKMRQPIQRIIADNLRHPSHHIIDTYLLFVSKVFPGS